jgi:hypothetical protein
MRLKSMNGLLRTGFAMLISYLVAGAAVILYDRWPHYEGHAHVPFSGFPEFLVWSPVAPYFVICDLFTQPPKGLGGSVLFVVVFGAVLWPAVRVARRGTKTSSN